jgi:hypothetical protein
VESVVFTGGAISSVTTIGTSGDADILGNIELGNAADTTLSRAAAGVLAVEGNTVVEVNHATGGIIFTGPTQMRSIAIPDANSTVLTTNAAVTVAQGGTGRATGTTAYALVATGTTATGAQQTLAQGAAGEMLVGAGAALPTWVASTAMTIDWVTTGYVEGGSRTVETTTDVDVTVTGSAAFFINNHASTINYTLPADPETAGGDSKVFCFRNRQAQVITVTPAAGDVIELEGTDAAASEAIVSAGAVGEFICLQGFDDAGTDRWVSWGQNSLASWAEATP